MNNYEVLKECKIVYEYLQDLLENCEYIGDEDTKSIELLKDRNTIINTIDLMEKLYNKAYQNEESKEELGEEVVYNETLKPKSAVNCPHCGKEMYVSDIIDYAYVCPNCDENFYSMECDNGYAWWNED